MKHHLHKTQRTVNAMKISEILQQDKPMNRKWNGDNGVSFNWLNENNFNWSTAGFNRHASHCMSDFVLVVITSFVTKVMRGNQLNSDISFHGCEYGHNGESCIIHSTLGIHVNDRQMTLYNIFIFFPASFTLLKHVF